MLHTFTHRDSYSRCISTRRACVCTFFFIPRYFFVSAPLSHFSICAQCVCARSRVMVDGSAFILYWNVHIFTYNSKSYILYYAIICGPTHTMLFTHLQSNHHIHIIRIFITIIFSVAVHF